MPVSPEEAEGPLEERDIERIQKKRLYAIIDALFKFMISYRENFADTPIEKVLLCGIVDNVEKIAGALKKLSAFSRRPCGTRLAKKCPGALHIPRFMDFHKGFQTGQL